VLVTGGAGFVGSHLVERLVGDGFQVVVVDDLSSGRMRNVVHLVGHKRFRLVRADVVKGLHWRGPLSAVAHLASPASPVDYAERPVETLLAGSAGTLHALELARGKGARFLLASTSEVYGDPAVHPQPEEYWGHVNPVGPRACYDEAKRYAEALTVTCRDAWGVDGKIARIFNTYGPRMRSDDGRAVPAFLRQALAGEPMTVAGDGRQTRSLCYVSDLVDGLIRLLWSDVPGPVNLGNPQEIAILTLAHAVRAAAGSGSRVVSVDRPVEDPQRRCPDIRVAQESLGWSPLVGLEEGLALTVAAAQSRVVVNQR
jgi:dTDP-glucose 4,6-dehydratase